MPLGCPYVPRRRSWPDLSIPKPTRSPTSTSARCFRLTATQSNSYLKVIVLGDGGKFLATRPDELSVHKTRSLSWLAQFVTQIVTTLRWEQEFRTDDIDDLGDFKAVIAEANDIDATFQAFRCPAVPERPEAVKSAVLDLCAAWMISWNSWRRRRMRWPLNGTFVLIRPNSTPTGPVASRRFSRTALSRTRRNTVSVPCVPPTKYISSTVAAYIPSATILTDADIQCGGYTDMRQSALPLETRELPNQKKRQSVPPKMVSDTAIHFLNLDIELLPVEAPRCESVCIARWPSSSLSSMDLAIS